MAVPTNEIPLTIDPAGRFAWPDALEQIFGDTVVMSRWTDRCLIATSQEVWKDLQAGFDDPLPTAQNAFLRRLTAGVQTVTRDSNHRMLVPRHLRAWAGIDQRGPITLSWQNRWIEIWSTPKLEKYLEDKMVAAEARMADQLRMGVNVPDKDGP